jgi:hypothetical protein
MTRTGWTILVLLASSLAGCGSGKVPLTAKPVIDRFLSAAAAGDSVALARLTTNMDPVRRAIAVRNREPLLLATLRSHRRLRSAVTRGDTTFIAFRIRVSDATEIAAIGLVHTPSGAWLVYYFGIPSRG